MQDPNPQTPTDDDLDTPIWGARAMAPWVNLTVRQVHYMLARGMLDAKKEGARYVSTPRKLRRGLEVE